MVFTEQRRFERYFPPEGAIATLKPSAEFGLVNDISKGGAAFEYLAISQKSETEPKIGAQREIDIFIPGRGTQPISVSCRIIRIEEKLLGSYANAIIPKKRCSVEFTGLSEETGTQLDTLLAGCQHCKGGNN